MVCDKSKVVDTSYDFKFLHVQSSKASLTQCHNIYLVGTLGTCLYQYQVTTKLSLAIILIKQIYVYVTTVVLISEIAHIIMIIMHNVSI